MQKSINKLIKTLDWNRVEAKLDKKLTLPITVEGYKQCYLQGGGTDGKYGLSIKEKAPLSEEGGAFCSLKGGGEVVSAPKGAGLMNPGEMQSISPAWLFLWECGEHRPLREAVADGAVSFGTSRVQTPCKVTQSKKARGALFDKE